MTMNIAKQNLQQLHLQPKSKYRSIQQALDQQDFDPKSVGLSDNFCLTRWTELKG